MLNPSDKIARDFKLGYLSKEEFASRYMHQLKYNPMAQEMISFIIKEAKDCDVYLVCNDGYDGILVSAFHELQRQVQKC